MRKATAIPCRGASPTPTAAGIAADAFILVGDTDSGRTLRTIGVRALRRLVAGTGGLQEHRRRGGYLARFGIGAGSLLSCRGSIFGADNGTRLGRRGGHD